MLINKYSHKKFSKGDTLIEVLFAVSVFSLVVVGALSIMNQGTSSAERSLEITLVRQQIDAQAETLRYLNASFNAGSTAGVSEWQKIQVIAKINNQATTYNSTSCTIPNPNKVFILNTHTAKFDNVKPGLATIYSQVRYVGEDSVTSGGDVVKSVEGIWIEPVSSPNGSGYQSNAGYIDFHIRACWDSPGQSFPVAIGTIVRLYETRS